MVVVASWVGGVLILLFCFGVLVLNSVVLIFICVVI